MTRRLIGLLVTLTLGLLMGPLAVAAQPMRQAPARLGLIFGADPQRAAPFLEAFRQALQDLGWVEGQNVSLESRYAEGQADRYPGLAADLVRLPVDVIIAAGTPALQALQQATSRIPIVSAVLLFDPVRLGLVASLAHPGGNLTGLASQYEELVTKHVELLADVVPTLSRIVLLRHASTDPTATRAAAADKRGLTAQILEVSAVGDFEGAVPTK